jgi:ABC-type antimicrobial peptide transport system permease subunit
LALETASDRLSRLQEVQNTYLRIFSALGGLGLLLSTAALGLLVARNVLERRGELALLQAMGFTLAKIRQTVLGEHLPLFVIAFVLGLAAAALAIWPHLQEGGGGLPLTLLATVLGGLALGGLLFCWLAAKLALRRPLLTSLRQE